METSKDKKENKFKKKLSDPYAWIVLRLPSRFWVKAQIVLETLKANVRWSVLNGEIKLEKDNSTIKNSNIVQIVYHAVDPSTLEPVGYKDVFPFLPKGSTKPTAMKKLNKLKKTSVKKFQRKKGVIWETDST